jgi:hypothetical protein
MIHRAPAIDRIGVTGIERGLEAARHVRSGSAENDHADRHDDEGDQSADASHLSRETDRDQAGSREISTATMTVLGTG